MNILFRNFFYAVGLTTLFFMWGSDASAAMFADLVRLVQSPVAFKIVLTLTALFVGLELALSGSGRAHRSPNHSVKTSNGGSSKMANS